MTLTPEQRDELRALADAATPGPWSYPSEILGLPCSTVFAGDPKRTHAAYVAAMGPHDGKFIATARTAVPALLDALDAAEAERDRLHSWAGLMELLDEHYPADLIPTAPDDPARDAGPRIVSLIRRVDAAEAARDTAERQVKAVRELHKRGEVMAWQEDCTNPEGHDCMDDPHGGGMLCTDEIVGHYCHGCAPEDAADVDEYPWPCPTIRALDGEAGR